MTDGDTQTLRDVLLAHSDHQAVRQVFSAHTGTGTATTADFVETMRETNGDIAIVTPDDASEIYARWHASNGRFEYITVWPPWTIGGYNHTDRRGLIEYLASKNDIHSLLHEQTPFADQTVLSHLTPQIWP